MHFSYTTLILALGSLGLSSCHDYGQLHGNLQARQNIDDSAAPDFYLSKLVRRQQQEEEEFHEFVARYVKHVHPWKKLARRADRGPEVPPYEFVDPKWLSVPFPGPLGPPVLASAAPRRPVEQPPTTTQQQAAATSRASSPAPSEPAGPAAASGGQSSIAAAGHLPAAPSAKKVGRPAGERLCDICGKVFNQSFTMKRHRLTHVPQRPFSCQICSATFKRNDQLRGHMNSHSTERPFQCPKCPATYKWQRGLQKHVQAKHDSIKHPK